MGTEKPLSASAPPLAVRAQGSDRTLPAGPSYTIGRDPKSDIVVNEDRVSWQHAVLKLDRGSWVLEDTGSTNGTFVGSQKVQKITLDGETTVRLGHPVDGPELTCSTGAPARPATVHRGQARHARQRTRRLGWACRGGGQAGHGRRAHVDGLAPRAQRDPPAADQGAADRPRPGQRHRHLRPERLPLPRRAAPDRQRVPDRRPGQPQRDLRQRPAGRVRAADRRRHRGHRALHVPPVRHRAAGVRRHRGRLAGGPRPDRHPGQRQGPARPRHLPARRALPAGDHRPQRRRQVHPARRADRHAARQRRQRPLRRPRPVRALRGAAAPDRARPAGEHPAHPADGPPRASLCRGTAVPARHEQGRAQPAGGRGARGALPHRARRDPHRPAVRRPAEAGQRRAGADDQAVAAVPGRADVRPGPGAGQVGHGDDVRPGQGRPHRHRGHAQRRQPGHLRPPARPGARREGRLLRPAAGRAEALRQAGLGRGLPVVRRRAAARLGGGVPAVGLVPAVRPVRGGRARAARPRRARSRPRRRPRTGWPSSARCAGATCR